jgi:hypothetical protein
MNATVYWPITLYAMKNPKIKKTLCKLDKHDMEERMDTIMKLVAEPHYFCCKCARVATEKKYLCKPVKIKLSGHIGNAECNP